MLGTSEPMNRRIISSLIVSSLMCAAGYAALFIAPDERTMHDAQRIFYFHLPSWLAMFLALFVSVFGNISYLFTRKQASRRLAWRSGGRTGRGVLYDWARDWSVVGKAG